MELFRLRVPAFILQRVVFTFFLLFFFLYFLFIDS